MTSKTKASWIRFTLEGQSATRRTNIWAVQSQDGAYLGSVKWYTQWRQYAFFPCRQTIFEEDCLREIADFCQEKTSEQRGKQKARRADDRARNKNDAGLHGAEKSG